MNEAKGKTATRAAILDAAKKLFAAKGFGAATVRDICTAAGANIALVSRYFGSKRELYAEVCRALFDGLAAPLAQLDAGIVTAEDWRRNVREWIGHALRLTSATRSPEKEVAGIFRQEMFNPSPMCKHLRSTFMMPVFNCLKRLVEMGGSRSEAETLALTTRIWSQISFMIANCVLRPTLVCSAGISKTSYFFPKKVTCLTFKSSYFPAAISRYSLAE